MSRLLSAAHSILRRPLLPAASRIAALLAVAFAALYAGTSRGVFVFGDDILMYQVSEGIWERGEVAVTSPHWRGDVARSARGVDQRRYSKYGLGLSLVALPFYGASEPLFGRYELPETVDRVGNLRTGAKVFGTALTNAAAGGATVGVTFLIAVELGYPIVAALATALCLGLGTLLAHYSGTFLSEPLSALCFAVALLALLRARGGATRREVVRDCGRFALFGFAAGLAVATKVAHLVALLPLLFWAAALSWRRERWRDRVAGTLAWALSFALWIGAVGFYNAARFGSLFETGYGKEASSFTTPLWVGLSGLVVAPAKGVLWYSPVLILALFGVRAFWRRDRGCALAILGVSAAWLLLIARYYQWYGGGCWGPRFLVPLLPLWVLPASELFLIAARRRGVRLAVATIVVVSLAVAWTPVVVPFDQGGGLLLAGEEIEAAAWRLDGSHLAHELAHLPRGLAVTARKLAGLEPFGEGARPQAGPRFPDFAFEHYGSHALLQWTRACFALAGLAAAAALAVGRAAGRGAQKALLSRPPQ